MGIAALNAIRRDVRVVMDRSGVIHAAAGDERA